MVEGLPMVTQKKECQINSFEEFLKQLVCRFAYWSFPFTDLLSIPGLSLSFRHFVPPSHINFKSFPWLAFILEAFTDPVCGSLFLLSAQSLYINILTSPNQIEFGWLSPYPSPTTTWGIFFSIKPRTVAVFFILRSHYSYIRGGTGRMNSTTQNLSPFLLNLKNTQNTPAIFSL